MLLAWPNSAIKLQVRVVWMQLRTHIQAMCHCFVIIQHDLLYLDVSVQQQVWLKLKYAIKWYRSQSYCKYLFQN